MAAFARTPETRVDDVFEETPGARLGRTPLAVSQSRLSRKKNLEAVRLHRQREEIADFFNRVFEGDDSVPTLPSDSTLPSYLKSGIILLKFAVKVNASEKGLGRLPEDRKIRFKCDVNQIADIPHQRQNRSGIAPLTPRDGDRRSIHRIHSEHSSSPVINAFRSRSNVAEFLDWATSLGAPDITKFTTTDLVNNENELQVLTHLLTVTALQTVFEPPARVQKNREAFKSGAHQYGKVTKVTEEAPHQTTREIPSPTGDRNSSAWEDSPLTLEEMNASLPAPRMSFLDVDTGDEGVIAPRESFDSINAMRAQSLRTPEESNPSARSSAQDVLVVNERSPTIPQSLSAFNEQLDNSSYVDDRDTHTIEESWKLHERVKELKNRKPPLGRVLAERDPLPVTPFQKERKLKVVRKVVEVTYRQITKEEYMRGQRQPVTKTVRTQDGTIETVQTFRLRKFYEVR
eukprot:m.351732 g.351732  ORF g.351732 m.351732 type:complete len:459 (-) comp20705_c1_seq6:242-1618(-)